ncbi:hypothetical protein H0H92_000251, partial [Tricholoma furcatifolium]
TQIQEELVIHRDDVDLKRRALVLDSDFLRQWFLQRGYTLYSAWKRAYDWDCEGFEPHASSSKYDNDNVQFPYAYSGGDDMLNIFGHPPLYAPLYREHRHVAIKIVKDASDEYKVSNFLFQQGIPNSMEEFNHVIPVLDMLHFGKVWFVVMPRFQDMSDSNILVNHFGRHENDVLNATRSCMRQQGQLTYALFDFDLSTKFPSSWSDEQCRLPYYESWKGTVGLIPPDTWSGELDFDPFALDVGALGMIFSLYYDHLTLEVPMLAPLFDKMLTHDIPRRFTAEQALHFLESEVYPRTSLAQLSLGAEDSSSDSQRGRWEGLDPTFLDEWAAYRSPPLPWTTKFLRSICEHDWIFYTVVFLRRSMYKLRRAMSYPS